MKKNFVVVMLLVGSAFAQGSGGGQSGTGGGGGVSSVGLTANSGATCGALAISGSPITVSGTINLGYTGVSGDVLTFNASNCPVDSGTLLSSLTPPALPISIANGGTSATSATPGTVLNATSTTSATFRSVVQLGQSSTTTGTLSLCTATGSGCPVIAAASGSISGTLTIPDVASDSFAMLAATQIFTNKSIQMGQLTGTTAAATATETAVTRPFTYAGIETAALTYPWVFTNANSSTNNSSGALLVGTSGTSTGAVPLVVNEGTSAGDLLDMYNGGTVTAGAISGGTKEYAFGSTGVLTLGASAPGITTNGTTPYFNMNTLVQGAVNKCAPTSAVTLSGTTAIICTWTLPNAAKTWFWQCSGTYSITAGTTPGLTLQMNAAQAPTNETGQAIIGSLAASGAITQTFQTGLGTSTSAGAQTVFADSPTVAITTVANAPWSTSGSIQASATSGTFAIQALLSGTGTPAGTINVGSGCTIQ